MQPCPPQAILGVEVGHRVATSSILIDFCWVSSKEVIAMSIPTNTAGGALRETQAANSSC